MEKENIDFKSPVPLYYQLKELIKHEISSHSWKPDKMIPSETELSITYNVSIGTVKKAISQLAHEGILYRRQGKGTFVARPNFEQSFIRFFRFAVDGNKKRILPTSKIINLKVMKPSKKIRNILNLEANEDVLYLKRLRLVKEIPLVLEDLYLPKKLFPGFEKIDTTDKLLYPIYEEKYNLPVIWADEFLEPRVATEEEAHYLGIRRGDTVIFIERIAYTYGDKPIEYRSSTGRGDRFRYHIEIR